MINDYLGKSEIIHGIELFPVSILEWEEFESVGCKYLVYGYNFINYRLKPNKEDVRPFDLLMSFIANDILESKNQNCNTVAELERMFNIVTKKEAKLNIDVETGKWSFIIEDKEINRDNFDDIITVIMRQNLIFEPLIVEDEYTQQIIDDAIRVKNIGGGEFDFKSMLIYVCNRRNLSPSDMSNYTYYQLRCDNEMIQRIEFNDSIHHYRSQGAKVESVNFYKTMETLSNPNSWDKLFKRVDQNSDKKMEQVMKG